MAQKSFFVSAGRLRRSLVVNVCSCTEGRRRKRGSLLPGEASTTPLSRGAESEHLTRGLPLTLERGSSETETASGGRRKKAVFRGPSRFDVFFEEGRAHTDTGGSANGVAQRRDLSRVHGHAQVLPLAYGQAV